jgi:crotonobetainyl-CoA:carnitine CoA-transferase CaiB-like acyl-CoA transferase
MTKDAVATGPLAGVRVVELGVWVAGPAAAGLMADWGADVVKVEPPAGDPQRRVFGALGVADQQGVPPFEIDNRGKRSVVLDLQTDDGRVQMERLLATADVFVTNVRPEALARLGLAHDEVLARHPRLVYASLTGYGLEGPERDRAGYDIGAFWARSGLAHTMVPPDELPPGLRSGMGDHVTGMSLLGGVLAKLLER